MIIVIITVIIILMMLILLTIQTILILILILIRLMIIMFIIRGKHDDPNVAAREISTLARRRWQQETEGSTNKTHNT